MNSGECEMFSFSLDLSSFLSLLPFFFFLPDPWNLGLFLGVYFPIFSYSCFLFLLLSRFSFIFVLLFRSFCVLFYVVLLRFFISSFLWFCFGLFC